MNMQLRNLERSLSIPTAVAAACTTKGTGVGYTASVESSTTFSWKCSHIVEIQSPTDNNFAVRRRATVRFDGGCLAMLGRGNVGSNIGASRTQGTAGLW